MIQLTEEQMQELAERFFENEYYAIDGSVLMIDGHVSISTILEAADWIRENGKEVNYGRVRSKSENF